MSSANSHQTITKEAMTAGFLAKIPSIEGTITLRSSCASFSTWLNAPPGSLANYFFVGSYWTSNPAVRGMYGLPKQVFWQTRYLRKDLAVHNYYKAPHISGLFTHKTRPIWFTYAHSLWFWCQIHQKGTHRTPKVAAQRALQDGERLERKIILQHHPQMELQKTVI